MQINYILNKLEESADLKVLAHKARHGIRAVNTKGIPIPKLRALAREIGTDHEIAQELWLAGFHEARILASMVDDPSQVTDKQMEEWVSDFDSWDICDQCCSNLFDKTPFAYEKAALWAERKPEYEKRAGFTMMAVLAVHDKKAPDQKFLNFFPLLKKGASDQRNFVKKAVNWALRQIGKRNPALNKSACDLALSLRCLDSKPARWIAADALRELTGEKVQKRLQAKCSRA
ncbi:DNA alkylation repair protein [Dethiosulfatarculus sandiegensis]|uniref:DNA alkylation repair protein n=1 Tax=Dethiosulfatarculus sandiegensis TaxID=1429043 RepID=A0A0D2JEW5_9BACT|nr:DNA alkylation repair protein [Dethiosulfatarculus sandiegensis]KIX14216.1 DNA alkylation repair protein [Dethiosulfatarculus sandiegensis]